MAELTLAEASLKLARLGETTAQKCVDLMRDVTPQGATGTLRASIFYEMQNQYSFFVGTELYYAKWVDQGRGPVRPKYKKALAWGGYAGGPWSNHRPGDPGAFYVRGGAGPARPNPFVFRTKIRILTYNFTL